MGNAIHRYQQENKSEEPHAIRELLIKILALGEMVFNGNLRKLMGKITSGLFLSKSICFDKSPDANWYVTWHQDITINVNKRIETEGFTG